MAWSVFAILQTVVIAIAVSVAFWLRNRQIRQQNEQLRLHIAALEGQQSTNPDQPSNAPAQWIADKIAQIGSDTPYAPLLTLVLQHQLEPRDDFSERVIKVAAECGLAGEDPTQTAELEAALEQLREELAAAQSQNDNTTGDVDQSDELKNLLQQYTKDSRDMMNCIQTLEQENADLQKKLQENGLQAQQPVQDATSDPTAEQTADPAQTATQQAASAQTAGAPAEPQTDTAEKATSAV